MAIKTDVFNYTGTVQTFTAKKTGEYTFSVWGAQGGKGTHYSGVRAIDGGKGGYSTGVYRLQANQVIYINVGGAGRTGKGNVGGWNGGGATGNASYDAGGGGGATDIRVSGNVLGNRVIVAGGGGGGGNMSIGGDGGGLQGIQPASSTQYSSRIAGMGGTQKTGYQLGQGQGSNGENLCGGGGGGYYGGFQGANSTGGGGGSGYIGGVINGTTVVGVRSGNGYATISYLDGTTPTAPTNLVGIKVNDKVLCYEKIEVSWNASTNEDGPVTYRIEFYDGASWKVVANEISETKCKIQLSSNKTITNAKIRIQAVSPQGVESAYLESPVFTLTQKILLIENNKKIGIFKDGEWNEI